MDDARAVGAPKVSVILPVFNGQDYVAEAVHSILRQTFADFELLVVDDGSTDATHAILARLDDPRIILTRQQNVGLSTTLNDALSRCRGEYIARQDHDDVSMPTRLAQQVAFLDAHPTCGLLGTRSHIHDAHGATGRAHLHPCGDRALRFALLFDNPFVHSSVMLRKEAIARVGGYTTDPARQPEDYDLWSRIASAFEVANLPECLVVYREVTGSLSRVSERPFLRVLVGASARHLAVCLGTSGPTPAMSDAAALMHGAFDMLSPHPVLADITAVVRRAMLQIDAGAADAELHGVADRHLRQVRRRYYLRGRVPRALASALREVRRHLGT